MAEGKAGKRYPPEVKEKIKAAAKAVRDADKPWTEAHKAAQDAGYKGSMASLIQMMNPKKPKAKKGKRGRKPGRPAGKRRGRKPGPKPGQKRGRKPGRPKAAAAGGVASLVTGIMAQALDAAQAEINKLRKQYGV